MRMALMIVGLVACGGDPVETDTTPLDTDASNLPEERFDKSTWPETIGDAAGRPAAVYTPETYDGSSELPLLVLLHGYSANGLVQSRYFDLVSQVDVLNYILVTPDGTKDARGNRFWDAGDVCCDMGDLNPGDVEYITGLLDEAETRFPIDADRIMFIGHSNGGFMSFRMACEMSERVAGIASLAGAGMSDPADCAATTPVSILQMHGTDDRTIEYQGGSLSPGAPNYPGAEATVAYWHEKQSCGEPTVQGVVDHDKGVDGDETEKRHWSDCDGGVDVALWKMQDSGHIPTVNETWRDDVLGWLLAQRRVQ